MTGAIYRGGRRGGDAGVSRGRAIGFGLLFAGFLALQTLLLINLGMALVAVLIVAAVLLGANAPNGAL